MVFEYIQSYCKEHGYPPSVRDIGKAVGLKSSSTVHMYLVQLEELGLIRRDPGPPPTVLGTATADVVFRFSLDGAQPVEVRHHAHAPSSRRRDVASQRSSSASSAMASASQGRRSNGSAATATAPASGA